MRDIDDIANQLAEIPEDVNLTPRQREIIKEAVSILRMLEVSIRSSLVTPADRSEQP